VKRKKPIPSAKKKKDKSGQPIEGNSAMQDLIANSLPPYRLPTLFELAQLASSLLGNEKWLKLKSYGSNSREPFSVSHAALEIWRQCQSTLEAELDHLKYIEESEKTYPEMPDWIDNISREKEPIPFEKGLKYIFIFPRATSRNIDQTKQMRDFLRDKFKGETISNSPVEPDKSGSDLLAQFKTNGFKCAELIKFCYEFPKWRKLHLSEVRAQNARIRWEKR